MKNFKKYGVANLDSKECSEINGGGDGAKFVSWLINAIGDYIKEVLPVGEA